MLSDIHSNIYALEAIWAKERDADLILCTGDLVDYGLFPNEVIGWVRDYQVVCTQGNHDLWLALNYRRGQVYDTVPLEERCWVHYNASLLGEEDIAFLEGLPVALTFELDGITYGLTHLYKEYQEIVSQHAFETFTATAFNTNGSRITRLLMGHTHRQAVRYLSDALLWLNPGSVSYRRQDDPDQSAHYAVIEDGKISLRRATYNLWPVWSAARKVQLKDAEMQVAEFMFKPRD